MTMIMMMMMVMMSILMLTLKATGSSWAATLRPLSSHIADLLHKFLPRFSYFIYHAIVFWFKVSLGGWLSLSHVNHIFLYVFSGWSIQWGLASIPTAPLALLWLLTTPGLLLKYFYNVFMMTKNYNADIFIWFPTGQVPWRIPWPIILETLRQPLWITQPTFMVIFPPILSKHIILHISAQALPAGLPQWKWNM